MRDLILRIYDRVIDVIVIGLVLVMIIVMGFAFFDVLMNVWRLIPDMRSNTVDANEFRDLIVTVLDVFVLIELFSTFTSYVRTRHVGLTQLLDVTVVFALRELLVKLYANSFAPDKLIGLCIVVILLVIGRSLTGRLSPHAGT
ncbi:MAG: phosphate-starvation-inducible PsiE family protein [Steroidobacteraceae bacterium]